jgi:hypothetical protein
MNNQKDLQHFLLTRFNILLWKKDKNGDPVRTIKWLEHRFSLFERYCLPSVKGQTCQDFEWIVLFDSLTPERFKSKIDDYKQICPQLIPVFVEPENGRYFARIFREQILTRMRAKRVLTTYLDNDDALNVRFVEDLQNRASLVENGTFINYNDGYQFYVEHKYMLRIHYPRNHFVSVVEGQDDVKGIFGYGSHSYIHTIEGVRIENIKEQPMWCEVVHEKNMINDAYFIKGIRMIKDANRLRCDFSIDETVNHSMVIYAFKFLPRYFKTFVKRAKNRLFGKKW